MQTRRCGKTGPELTVINFGAMRMHGPDTERWASLVRQVADAGFNYFETSNKYCESTSEIKVGLGLEGFPRDKVLISTKSGARGNATADLVRKSIDESLHRLRTSYLDYYQLWGLSLSQFHDVVAKPGGMLAGVRAAMKEGLIRRLGFTTHDKPENMIALLRTGEFESITLQYNLLNRVNEPVIAEAAKLGIGVIVMGPLHGGLLGHDSGIVRKMLGGSSIRSTAEASFRFVLSNPHVTCAVSGMMDAREIDENRRIAEDFTPLSPRERTAVDEALVKYKAAAEALCTGCRYCMPCPQGVGISEIFRLANASRVYGLVGGAKRDYALFAKDWPYSDFKDATFCNLCGACLEKCPQKIAIPDELKKAHEVLKK